MNKTIIENAISSAIHVITDEMETMDDEELTLRLELTLAELEYALKELRKD